MHDLHGIFVLGIGIIKLSMPYCTFLDLETQRFQFCTSFSFIVK